MELITSGDESLYIRAAIDEIYWTIGITTALVGFVIFVFLGSLRATLIPLVTIPICLIATFAVLAAVRVLHQSRDAARARALDRPRRRRCDRRARERAPSHRGRRGAAARGLQRHAPGGVRRHRDDRRARVRVRARGFLARQHRPRVRRARRDDRGRRHLLGRARAVAVADDVLEAAALEHEGEQAHAHARPGVRVRCRTAIRPCLRATLRAPWVSVAACVAIAFGAYVLLQDDSAGVCARRGSRPVQRPDPGARGHELRAPARVGHEGRGGAAEVFRRRQRAARHRQRAGLGQQRLRHRERHAQAVRRAQDHHAGDAERPQQAVGRDPRRSRQRVHEQRQPRRRWRRWRRLARCSSCSAARTTRSSRAGATSSSRARPRIRASCGSIRICARRSRRCSCASTRTAPRASA